MKHSDSSEPRPTLSGGWRSTVMGAGALTLLGTLPLRGSQEGQASRVSETVENARETQGRWFDTRRLISKEKHDWVLGKEMLTQRIELVKQEIASLREHIAETEQTIADGDRKRAELVDESERLKRGSGVLAEALGTLEARTLALIARLPESLREHVQLLSQRIPRDAGESRQSLSERFQNVIGILNEADKFNRTISLSSEVRTLPDGSQAEVTALYVGLGQAYYVTARADAAGIGTASPEGWTWRPANEIAPAVARAVAVLQNEQEAAFVPLPVRAE
jgi:chromosome segregation ATPase